jgi:imidazolonepropionase-like amidohydrolase
VPFLAGTDAPTGVGLLPGFSLHHELARFVSGGFTPLEALQTATIGPAQFLGKERDLGTVATGKLADLLLLDADPTKDINNTRKIQAVVLAGRYLSRGHLDEILRKVKALTSP